MEWKGAGSGVGLETFDRLALLFPQGYSGSVCSMGCHYFSPGIKKGGRGRGAVTE